MRASTIIIFIYWIIISHFTVLSQETMTLRPSVKRLANKLAKHNVYETYIPSSHQAPKQIRYFERLKTLATDHELIQLTQHKNGVVRVYAFDALEDRNYSGLYDIIIQHIEDHQVIKWRFYGFEFISGRSGSREVGEFYVNSWELVKQDRAKLDSVLIFTDNHFRYTQDLLEKIPPTPSFYHRIRTLASHELNIGAIIALSKFNNTNDLALIERKILEQADVGTHYLLTRIMKAIEYFPNEYFKQTLDKLKEKGMWQYFETASVFKDSYSLNYLDSVINRQYKSDFARSKVIERVYQTIQKHKAPIYDSLLFKIWSTDHFITDSTLSYLFTVDSTKCNTLIERSLSYDGKIGSSWFNPVIPTMLNHLINKDEQLAIDLISSQLKVQQVFKYEYYADAAKRLNHPDIIQALLFRVQNDSNGHTILPSVATILSFKDPNLNNELINTIRSNSRLKNWILEDIKALLKKYHLNL